MSPMEQISQQRCFHHHLREAVVRCPQCLRYYCRECVTEHEERMLCSDCLGQLIGSGRTGRRRWSGTLQVGLQGVMGFVLLWYFFYLVGLLLLAIPHAFHEGTIWQNDWWRTP